MRQARFYLLLLVSAGTIGVQAYADEAPPQVIESRFSRVPSVTDDSIELYPGTPFTEPSAILLAQVDCSKKKCQNAAHPGATPCLPKQLPNYGVVCTHNGTTNPAHICR